MKSPLLYLFTFLFIVSCGSAEEATSTDESENIETEKIGEGEYIDINPNKPFMVEVIGIAANRKGGAVVISDENGEHYWIDNLSYWNEEFIEKKVIVTGQVVTRNDNPVFLDTSEIKSQGIPVYSEEQLENQKSRLWIINASYQLVE